MNSYCKLIYEGIGMSMATTTPKAGKWKVHKDHVGHGGIPDYADAATIKPAADITVTKIEKLPFMKGATARNAVVYVLYANKGQKPLYAIGFELKDAPGGDGVDTIQPDPKAVPFLYETRIGATNKASGKIDAIKLEIYTKGP
jgi:hypothetical protein